VVGRQNADIADTLHLRDVAMATVFWLSVYDVYGVHIGATWRIRLNSPCAAAMRSYVKYFDLLLLLFISSYSILACHCYSGVSKRTAEIRYLDRARRMAMYGVHLYPAKVGIGLQRLQSSSQQCI